MYLATTPNVIFNKISDILNINDLYYTHAIPLHVINTVLLPIVNKPNRNYAIYVVNYIEDMNEIMQKEAYSKNSDITNFDIEDFCVLSETVPSIDVALFKAVEGNTVLTREAFNIGISFIFIVKYLIQRPMTRA